MPVCRSLIHLLRPPSEYSVEEIYAAASCPSSSGQREPPVQQQPQLQPQEQQEGPQGAKKRTEAHALAAQALATELVCSSVLKRLASLAFNQLAAGSQGKGCMASMAVKQQVARNL